MKLFRNLRMSFIAKEKFRKYLLYAIGEILLVMIGISLAFQLDSWNENRIKKNTAIDYYKNIRAQVSDDKILLQEQIDFNRGYLSQFKYINEVLASNDRTKIDTLSTILGNLTQYSDFDKEASIYTSMVNSGEIKLLKNQDIVNSMRELEEFYNYLNRLENIHYDAMMNYMVSSMNPIINFTTGEIMKPDDLYSYQFQNLITAILQIMSEKDHAYNQALTEINSITELIGIELNGD